MFTIFTIFIPYLNESPLRTALGLLFVLFIPGYVLVSALFPKKDDLDGIERLALSFGLSLAVSPLIGLALNYTPWGIRLTPIVISLTLFTLLMGLVALFRRARLNKNEVFQPQILNHVKSLKNSFQSESRLDKILSVVLIISLLVAVSMTVYIVVAPQEGEKFTEFYILGPDGKASDYPTNLTVGETGQLIIGVVNREYTNVTYVLEIKLDGVVISEKTINLTNNEKWEEDFSFVANTTGENRKLEFLLYKLPDRTEPYRSLHLWVTVTGALLNERAETNITD
ncbi:MAG: DUF1616 domain-containing protein [Euryarchaeota archaeon]|nr:DUF1616 domain-containing protein [Euryarchaeota archaeon]MBV1768313.1 DUF1616 domain-containing protein [Methanobacterium sp.]